MYVRKLKGTEAPLLPLEPDGAQVTFLSLRLPCLQAFLGSCAPHIRSKGNICRALSYLPQLVLNCFWSHAATLFPRQWSNQANADTGAQPRVSLPTRTMYTSLMNIANQHWLWHILREHGMSAPYRDFFEGEKMENFVFLSAHLSLCEEVAARDGQEEIYITKHPQVHRRMSNTQMQAMTVSRMSEGVKGKKKEGWKPPWLHTARAWPEKRETCLSRMKGWHHWSKLSSQVFSASSLEWVSMMFGAKFRGVWRGIICLQSCVLIKKCLTRKLLVLLWLCVPAVWDTERWESMFEFCLYPKVPQPAEPRLLLFFHFTEHLHCVHLQREQRDKAHKQHQL